MPIVEISRPWRFFACLLVAGGLNLSVPGLTPAAELKEAAAGLKTRSFKEKAKVVAELAALGDTKAIPLLEAMSAGRLFFRKSDNALVIADKAGQGYRLFDAFTGRILGAAARRDVKKVRVNNRVRRVIKAALIRLELLSLDRGKRLAAAKAAVGFASAGMTALLNKALADITIYVIDVSAGDKIPRKGGPGITRSDLLVINKIDLAPHVGASLEVMERDAKKMRGRRPFIFTNLKKGHGVEEVVRFIRETGGLSLTDGYDGLERDQG